MAFNDEKNQTLLRIGFATVFLIALIYQMFGSTRVDVIQPEQCMVDTTFVWSDSINVFLRENLDIKNRYIIYASFMMDFMLLSFMGLFIFYWKSYRIILSYLMFFGMRTVI
jgi:hypothetical protein